MKFLSYVLVLFFFVHSAQAGMSEKSVEKKLKQAREYALKKKNKSSLYLIRQIEGAKFKPDETLMLKARVLYQMGNFDGAIATYKLISKSSDYWLEALEEMAWAYTLKNDLNKSYAELMTLLSPAFELQVNAEVYYLASVNRYYACDYSGVFKISKQMKTSYKSKIISLDKIKKKRKNKRIDQFISAALKSGVNFNSAAPYLAEFPQYFYKDQSLNYWFSMLEKWPKSTKFKNKIYRRLQTLASIELNKITKVIEKMGVVEAEVIQRVYEQNNKPVASQEMLPKADGNKTLSFPVTNDEVWLDELNSFQVRASNCPKLKHKEASL